MVDMLEWLCRQLELDKEIIKSPYRDRILNDKRQTIVAFYHYYCGLSINLICRIVNREHTSICHTLRVLKDENKNHAKWLYLKYLRDVEGKNIQDLPTPKIIKKIPDYLHSKVVEVEVEEKLFN